MTVLALLLSTAFAGIECPKNLKFGEYDYAEWKTNMAKHDNPAWRTQWEMGLGSDWYELKQMGWTFPSSEVSCGKAATIREIRVREVDVSPPGFPDHLLEMDWELCGQGDDAKYRPTKAVIIVPVGVGEWCRVPLFEGNARLEDNDQPRVELELVSFSHDKRKDMRITRRETLFFNTLTDGYKETVTFSTIRGIAVKDWVTVVTNFNGRTSAGPRDVFTATAVVEGKDLVVTKKGGCTEPRQKNQPVDASTCGGAPQVTRYVKGDSGYAPSP